MARAYVYIDGFNLYYSIKRTTYKWLNLKLLSNNLLSNHEVIRVKYFTAFVSGKFDTDTPRRQRIYLNALETLPDVDIYYGNYLAKNHWRRLVSFPYANVELIDKNSNSTTLGEGIYNLTVPFNGEKGMLEVNNNPITWQEKNILDRKPIRTDSVNVVIYHSEEKGSDVNLATQLLNDAWKEEFEVAAVISADTDLLEPIRMVVEERDKGVIVIAPLHRNVSAFSDVTPHTLHIHRDHLENSQFPSTIPNTKIKKPETW